MFVLLAAGLMLGRALDATAPALMLFSITSGACAIALIVKGWPCRILLALGVVAFGAGWFTIRLHETSPTSLHGRLAPQIGAPSVITVEGLVQSVHPPRPLPDAVLAPPPFVRPTGWIEVSVRRAEDAPARGVLRVSARALDMAQLQAGDHVRITGAARGVRPALNPGEEARPLVLRQQGVVGSMQAATIHRLPREALASIDRVRALWLRWRDRQQSAAESILVGDEPDAGRALLGAIVLGVRDDDATNDLFMRQGLGHLLAISGFHIAVMAALTMLVVRLTGDHGRLEPVIVAALLIVYMLLLPPRTSVMRAGLMVLVLLGADAAGRRYDRVNILAWIACLMLLVRPMDLWNMGFQLTFGVTAALILLYQRTLDRMLGPRLLVSPRPAPSIRRRFIIEPAAGLLCASLVAWTVAAPAVAFHTGIVSPLAIVSTMVLTPIVAASLWLSFVVLAIGVVVAPAAAPAAWLVGNVAGAAIDLVALIDAAPFTTLRVAALSPWWVLCATLVGVHWLTVGHWREVRSWVMTILVVGWLVVQCRPALPRDVQVRVDAVAVGSGSCLLVRSGDEAMLWDCGSTSPTLGRRVIPDAIRSLGAGRVRTIVITHANYDHYSAVPDVIEPLGVRTVLIGPSVIEQAQRPGNASRLLEAIQNADATVRVLGAGDVFTLGQARVTILSPPPGRLFATDNDNSLVAHVEVDAGSVLLTGDVEAPAVDALLESFVSRVTAMEAPHHGSATEAAIRLINAASPLVVLQSTNASRVNDDRLAPARRGRRWYATALDGASWLEIRESSIRSGALHAGAVSDPLEAR